MMKYIEDLQAVFNVARQAPASADVHDAVKAAAERVAKALQELDKLTSITAGPASQTLAPVESIESK